MAIPLGQRKKRPVLFSWMLFVTILKRKIIKKTGMRTWINNGQIPKLGCLLHGFPFLNPLNNHR